MARVAFPLVLQSPSTGSAIVGATATITQHVVGQTPGTGPQATIYTSETGTTTVGSNQITTDSSGRWTQGSGSGFAQYWLAQGTYDVQVSGTGLTTYTITRELFSAGQSDEVQLAGQPIWWPGPTVPSIAVAGDGAAYSRTGYANMFANLTVSGTANANGTTTLSNVSAAIMTALAMIAPANIPSGLQGIPISGTNVPSATYITAYNAGAGTITLSNSVASGTALPIVVAPHGVGNGTTTFNVPDLRLKAPVGIYPGGGLGSNAQYLGQTGGEEAHTLNDLESGVNRNAVTDAESGHTHTPPSGYAGYVTSAGSPQPYGIVGSSGAPVQVNGPANTGPSTGHTHPMIKRNADNAHNTMMPYLAGHWVIRHGLQ